MAVPLAWRNLTADKRRLALSLVGIAFAVLLMLMQLGFRNALVDSQVELVRYLNADIVLIHRSKYLLNSLEPFPRRRLFQALAVEGVAAADPVYIAFPDAMWKHPAEQTLHRVRVIGVNPEEPVFASPAIASQVPLLRTPDAALFDSRCRSKIGSAQTGDTSELTRRKIHIAGEFRLGTDFLVDGNIITSDRTFFNLFPEYRGRDPLLNRVELGLIRLQPGVSAHAMVAQLNDVLPDDVVAMTRQQLISWESHYWMHETAVGLVFNLGTLVGFIVGTVICAQILFTDISERMPQYATLKAIGYPNSHLVRVVLGQAAYLAMVGFVPGLIGSWAGYQLIAASTGLLMRLGAGLAVTVFVLTIAMCQLSGLVAVRKVLAADPADVF